MLQRFAALLTDAVSL